MELGKTREEVIKNLFKLRTNYHYIFQMNKVLLYINTLCNLSFNQMFFLGYNKIIKKYLNRYILQIDKKIINPKVRTDYDSIKKHINKVLGTEDSWKLGIEQLSKHSKYYNELKKNIIFYSKSSDISFFQNLWLIKSEDVELNYNYQRFYLFKEVFDEIKLSDEKQITLIKKWVELNIKNELAWSGFNCAIRLINWMKILKDIDASKIKVEQWEVIENSIYQQFIFNSKNIEHHIPGNHILFQYYSEWLISSIFTKWYSQKNQKERVLNRLLKEFEDEYLENGLHFELSTHYHLQVTLLGLTLINQLNNIGVIVPESHSVLMKKAINVLNKFLIGNYYPAISDGCYNFFHENKYQDLQNINYLKNKHLSLDNESKNQLLKDNNFQIIDNDLIKVIIDVGNIGLYNNPGHGHADLLSIVLGYNDIPIFIDPGTFQYNNKEESLMLKRTSFHNTVDVDGEDQAKLWGFFRWAYLPKEITSRSKTLDENTFLLEGEFLGYRHLGGIKHKRIIKIKEAKVTINDNLIGKLGSFVHINFILHPNIKIKNVGNSLLLESKKNLFRISSNQAIPFDTIDLSIYESYNTPIASKKIMLKYKTNNIRKFESEVIFEVIK